MAERQGRHPDPQDPETWHLGLASEAWPPRMGHAMYSAEMRTYADALRLEGWSDLRASVLNDLSVYFQVPPEQCAELCLGWEDWSMQEWNASPSMAEFYRHTRSWAFDLCWYAYLQACGFVYPVPVVIVRELPQALRQGGKLLDFGSGVGDAGALYRRLGFDVTLADVSTSLLEFAQWRLERRGDWVHYLDLNTHALPEATYDVVTAIDTLVLVPDFPRVVADLHRALKPNGLLFTTLDVRLSGGWHLYQDDLPLYWTLHRTGFERFVNLDRRVMGFRKVEPRGIAHQVRGVRDWVLWRGPWRRWYRRLRNSS